MVTSTEHYHHVNWPGLDRICMCECSVSPLGIGSITHKPLEPIFKRSRIIPIFATNIVRLLVTGNVDDDA